MRAILFELNKHKEDKGSCRCRTGVVFDPVVQTCLFDSSWQVDGDADDRRRLQSKEDSVVVCAAGAAEAVAKSEAAIKQELQTQLEELKDRMDEMQAAHAAETRELKAMLRQLLVDQ